MFSLVATLKLFKLISWLVVLGSAYAFWLRKLLRTRTKVLALLWMSLSLCFIFVSQLSSSEHEEEFAILIQGLVVTTPLFTTYWIFKGIKDWLDPKQV